ncbi:MAG: heparinase II/III family protein [Monoglobales bacterium]
MKFLQSLDLRNKIIPANEFVLFSDLKDKTFPSPESDMGKAEIALAEEYLNAEFPILNATYYMRFEKDGNRVQFENLYFNRRKALSSMVKAELIENKNRFVPKIMDIAWAIMEESTWVVPAHHNFARSDGRRNLPDIFPSGERYIDLFSAETGAILAIVYNFLGEKIKAANGQIIYDRIYFEVHRRIINLFLESDKMWWMGYERAAINNWNPWIISNILFALTLETDDNLRADVIEKAVKLLDLYIDEQTPDGGCNEGPNYWFKAGGTLFDALDILTDFTGGSVDLFSNEKIKNIVSYIYKVHIAGKYFITYGDAHAGTAVEGLFLRRMGQRMKDAKIEAFGQSCINDDIYSDYKEARVFNYGRSLKNILARNECTTEYVPDDFSYLPDMQLCLMRNSGGFAAWLKGGHNAESHNHNDIGSVGLYYNGNPIMIDIGVATYTKDTFNSAKRYTLFPMGSKDHSVPMIDGKGQLPGREYKADSFEAEPGIAKISYKSAYENRDEINLLNRTLSVTDSAVVIKDEIDLKEEKEIELSFRLYNKPEIKDNKVILYDGVVMHHPTEFEVGIEELPLEDEQLIKDWRTNILYKLYFKAKAQKLSAEFTVYKE